MALLSSLLGHNHGHSRLFLGIHRMGPRLRPHPATCGNTNIPMTNPDIVPAYSVPSVCIQWNPHVEHLWDSDLAGSPM
ncbi:MAG: hypothetical protein ACLU9S_05875 [Oscillospiraceae bacterium]